MAYPHRLLLYCGAAQLFFRKESALVLSGFNSVLVQNEMNRPSHMSTGEFPAFLQLVVSAPNRSMCPLGKLLQYATLHIGQAWDAGEIECPVLKWGLHTKFKVLKINVYMHWLC